MMRTTMLLGTLATLIACGGAEAEPQSTSSPPGQTQSTAMTCPMAQPGVDIATSDIDGGIAITFTGDAEQVDDLRAMARRMVSMHERHMAGEGGGGMHHRGGDGDAGMGGGGMGGMMMMMTPADMTVEDVEDGVRVDVIAQDPADVENLRAQVRQHAERMRAGECPMMESRDEGR